MNDASQKLREMTLLSGAIAYLAESDGHKTVIRSPEPSPPGSVVRAKVEGLTIEFQLKVRNCRKDGDLFRIDGRMQNATREMKAWLFPS